MDAIKGLTYIEDFLTVDEEQHLINNINNMEWNTDLKRRTQHFGYKYPYNFKTINELIETTPIPSFIETILNKVNNQTNKNFNQIIINEYNPGQGIASHTDNITLFGDTVVSLSLNSNIVMEFSYDNLIIKLPLKRKSLIILQDDARYKWRHGITAKKYDDKIKRDTRISVTFRETK